MDATFAPFTAADLRLSDGATFTFRPTLRGAARVSAANRLARAYVDALRARDESHDTTAGWSAVRRTVRDITERGTATRMRNVSAQKSFRLRSFRNARARRDAANLNPANVGCTSADEKATLAYMAQAFKYRLVRLLASA